MSDPAVPTLDALLRLCGDAAPAPWYPSAYAQAHASDRDALDEPLTQLRMAGLLQLTDWEAGKGQGYTPTEAGRAVLGSPRLLARLRAGDLARVAPKPEAPEKPVMGSSWERGEAVRSALEPSRQAPVTKVLVGLQVVVFAAGFVLALRAGTPPHQYLDTGESGLMRRLQVFAPALIVGQWWRLLGYCLVHVGIVHLVMNLLSHLMLGPVTERMFGSVRFLVLYLLAGLGGGCGAVIANSKAPAAGSSGALCGLVAAQVVWVYLNRTHLGPRLVADLQRLLFGTVLLVALSSFVPQVSWGGHLGGFVVGGVAAALLNAERFAAGWRRLAAVFGLLLVPVACVLVLHWWVLEPMWREAVRLDEARRRDEQIRDALLAEAADQPRAKSFVRDVLPEIDAKVMKPATLIYLDYADRLIQQPPARRDAGEVEDALPKLAELRERQSAAARLLAETPPFRSERVEAVRKAGQKLLDAEARLTAQFERCLRDGEHWTAADRAALDDLRAEVRALETQWREALR